MNLNRRLAKLEAAANRVRADGPCPWPYFTAVVTFGAPVPDDTPVCPSCGLPHVLEIVHEIVEAQQGTADANPAMA